MQAKGIGYYFCPPTQHYLIRGTQLSPLPLQVAPFLLTAKLTPSSQLRAKFKHDERDNRQKRARDSEDQPGILAADVVEELRCK
jgi:hypothetical protein